MNATGRAVKRVWMIGTASSVAIGLAALGGCSTVGVTSIDLGRTPYNQVIEQTSQQQALLNIVRTMRHEPPLFLDVTEVDQATTVNGSVSGGPSAIGAFANPRTSSAGTLSGTVGAITGAAGYIEAPTVRYLPLAGQALIAQVSTPITPSSLADLINSDWPIMSVLTLGVNNMTPKYSDYDTAVDAISELDKYGAIVVAATTKAQATPPIVVKQIEIAAAQPEAKDNLIIYYHPEGIAVSASLCDSDIDLPNDKARIEKSKEIVAAMWRRLASIYYPDRPTDKPPNFITISSKGTPGVIKGVTNKHSADLSGMKALDNLARYTEAPQAPSLVTRSALGVLKMAAEQDGNPTIELKTPSEIRQVVDFYNSNRRKFCDDKFYEIPQSRSTPAKDLTGFVPSTDDKERADKLAKLIGTSSRSLYTLNLTKTQVDFDLEQTEKILANQRRLMLIAHSPDLPSDADIAVPHAGEWYYIIQGDDISKRTLALISQFNTIQALPTQSPPLTPTISVGAR